jgi:LacI family transcriptional regulator
MGVTIYDVAAAAGVSASTVSRALSGRRPVSPEVEQAVRAACEELGYRTNVLARSLRLQTTDTVGMVVPGISNPFFPAIVEAVERELSVGDRQLLLADSQDSTEVEAARLTALLDRRIDGLLVVPCDSEGSAEALHRAAAQAPVVLLDRAVEGVSADFVGVDNAAGIVLAVDHLRARGCASFAFVSADDTMSSARARLQAFGDAAGHEHRVLLGDFTLDWGRQAAEQLLRDGLPDAIVCGADVVAFGVLGALADADVRVPRDVQVTGFDDIGFARLSAPALTTVRQPTDRLGAEGIQLLLRRIDGAGGAPESHILAPELRVRASTSAPSGLARASSALRRWRGRRRPGHDCGPTPWRRTARRRRRGAPPARRLPSPRPPRRPRR